MGRSERVIESSASLRLSLFFFLPSSIIIFFNNNSNNNDNDNNNVNNENDGNDNNDSNNGDNSHNNDNTDDDNNNDNTDDDNNDNTDDDNNNDSNGDNSHNNDNIDDDDNNDFTYCLFHLSPHSLIVSDASKASSALAVHTVISLSWTAASLHSERSGTLITSSALAATTPSQVRSLPGVYLKDSSSSSSRNSHHIFLSTIVESRGRQQF
tara:strand:+ start:375 stop:1004 length:630 start_codon:yes stop_codon:yes gene_type:complete